MNTDTTAPTCVVCTGETHTGHQTCINCINRARNLLTDIHEGWTRLPDAIKTLTGISYSHTHTPAHDTTVPGGDALVMLTGGTGDNPTSLNGHRPHADDHRQDDPPSLAGELATIEDDWRHVTNSGAAPYEPSVTHSIRWMVANIHTVAQHHPDFADSIDTLRKLTNRVTTVTGTSTAPVPIESAGCLDCGGTLVRDWTDKGLGDTVNCHACGRTYTDLSYRLAIRHHIQTEAPKQRRDALITIAQAKQVFPNARANTLDVWQYRAKSSDPRERARCPIEPAGWTRDGKPKFRLGDIADTLDTEAVAS